MHDIVQHCRIPSDTIYLWANVFERFLVQMMILAKYVTATLASTLALHTRNLFYDRFVSYSFKINLPPDLQLTALWH